jgi:hypothetical protein
MHCCQAANLYLSNALGLTPACCCAAVLQAAPLLAIPSFLRLEQFLLSKQEEGYRALLQQVGLRACLLVCSLGALCCSRSR